MALSQDQRFACNHTPDPATPNRRLFGREYGFEIVSDQVGGAASEKGADFTEDLDEPAIRSAHPMTRRAVLKVGLRKRAGFAHPVIVFGRQLCAPRQRYREPRGRTCRAILPAGRSPRSDRG